MEGTRLVFCSTMHSSLVHVLMLAAWSLMYPWLLWREFCRPVSNIAFNYSIKLHEYIAVFTSRTPPLQWSISKPNTMVYSGVVAIVRLIFYPLLQSHHWPATQSSLLIKLIFWHSVVEFQICCKSRHTCVQPKTSDSSQPFCHGLWACMLIWGAVKTKLIHSKWWLGGSITFCPDPNHNPDSTLGMFCIFRYALML